MVVSISLRIFLKIFLRIIFLGGCTASSLLRAGFSLVAMSGDSSLVVVLELLTAVAFLRMDQGSRAWGLQ